ncbi:hypothetical protein H7J07_06100 [Mycobacterium koreense]|uniref:Uncharacterized protein n=1 Tax=Mycolicibacillus koreensis TaxID=1069220 RepID=A0A7I7SDK4_9MYCO|nr:hypothetical protein [Mycolicibacillus koreensis]MCV7247799.1 hypothetical protein [Mycolicibacillus koreensis]OSC34685.1 hypothetical protein B8W67_05405 [Mycolicibacillus koreensis]BBY54186.1 hypothetical protein MKOR_14370 [Mycolicibacillus koreensis]
MLARLLWRVVTPRQLRRAALVVLLVWLGFDYLHSNGTIDQLREDLPSQVKVTFPSHIPQSYPNYR